MPYIRIGLTSKIESFLIGNGKLSRMTKDVIIEAIERAFDSLENAMDYSVKFSNDKENGFYDFEITKDNADGKIIFYLHSDDKKQLFYGFRSGTKFIANGGIKIKDANSIEDFQNKVKEVIGNLANKNF